MVLQARSQWHGASATSPKRTAPPGRNPAEHFGRDTCLVSWRETAEFYEETNETAIACFSLHLQSLLAGHETVRDPVEEMVLNLVSIQLVEHLVPPGRIDPQRDSLETGASIPTRQCFDRAPSTDRVIAAAEEIEREAAGYGRRDASRSDSRQGREHLVQ